GEDASLENMPRLHQRQGREPLLELRDPRLEHRLLVLGAVVFGVLGDVPELAGGLDPLRDLATAPRREILDLFLEGVVALFGQDVLLQSSSRKGKSRPVRAARGREW